MQWFKIAVIITFILEIIDTAVSLESPSSMSPLEAIPLHWCLRNTTRNWWPAY